MNPLGSYEAVKQGWSWPAFFFGFIWALFKKMWVLGFGIFFSFMFISWIIGGTTGGGPIPAVITNIGGIILFVAFGVNGNKWRGENLISRGFDLKGTVSASNSKGAIALYLKEHQV